LFSLLATEQGQTSRLKRSLLKEDLPAPTGCPIAAYSELGARLQQISDHADTFRIL